MACHPVGRAQRRAGIDSQAVDSCRRGRRRPGPTYQESPANPGFCVPVNAANLLADRTRCEPTPAAFVERSALERDSRHGLALVVRPARPRWPRRRDCLLGRQHARRRAHVVTRSGPRTFNRWVDCSFATDLISQLTQAQLIRIDRATSGGSAGPGGNLDRLARQLHLNP